MTTPTVYCNPLSGGYYLVVITHAVPSTDGCTPGADNNGLRPIVAVVDASQSMQAYSAHLIEGVNKLIAAGAEVILFSTSATRIIPREEDGEVDWKTVQTTSSWMQCTNYQVALEALYELVAEQMPCRPLVSMMTDGQPNEGSHLQAVRRLKAANIDVRTVYFGSLTSAAHTTLSQIDCGSPTSINSTSASLDSYIQSLLALRLQPIVNTVTQSVRIADMEVRIVKTHDVQPDGTQGDEKHATSPRYNGLPLSASMSAEPLPEKLELSTATQLATCLIAFLQKFGLHYGAITQDIVRFGSIRLGRHSPSRCHLRRLRSATCTASVPPRS